MLLITISAVLFFLIVAGVFLMLQGIQTRNAGSTENSQEFSIERYRPMLRLLDESEFNFVEGAPGHSRELRRFRSERRSMFRAYLGDLRADHSRILGSIRTLLVESQIDRPDLAVALYRCQLMFGLAMFSIEFKLFLHATGIGTVDIKSLVSAVDGLQSQFQDMKFVQAVGAC